MSREEGTRKKIYDIIRQKKFSDPVGLLNAQKEGSLAAFLSDELTAAGISVEDVQQLLAASTSASASAGNGGSGSGSSSNHNNSNDSSNSNSNSGVRSGVGSAPLPTSLGEAANAASSYLDDCVFAPRYAATASSFENAVCSKIESWNLLPGVGVGVGVGAGVGGRGTSRSPEDAAFDAVKQQLQQVKLAAFAGGMFCAVKCLGALVGGRGGVVALLRLAVFGLLAADLLIVSYNCYLKRYCTLVAKKLAGNASRLGSTVFQWLQSSGGASDPFNVIKERVVWDVLYTDTFSYRLYVELQKRSQQTLHQVHQRPQR